MSSQVRTTNEMKKLAQANYEFGKYSNGKYIAQKGGLGFGGGTKEVNRDFARFLLDDERLKVSSVTSILTTYIYIDMPAPKPERIPIEEYHRLHQGKKQKS